MPDQPMLAADAAPTIEDFLAKLKGNARSGFLSLRALLVSLGADVTEEPHENEVVYARARPFAIARIVRAKLHLVLPDGDKLPDPLGRLLRKGNERHVRLDDGDELDAHLQEFVRKAYVLARSST